MKSRKATIKKPKFLVPYFISVLVLLAVFTTAGVIYFMPDYYVYNFRVMESARWYEETIARFFEEVLTEPELSGNDLAYAKENLINHYCVTGERYEVVIDGKDRLDTSRDAILTYTYRAPDGDGDRAYFQLADKAYLKYFDTPEVQAESFIDKEYSQYFTHSPKIEFECREFYADLEKGVFIPVSVRIIDANGDDTNVSFKIKPENTEGMTLINPEYDGFMFANGTVAGDPYGGASLESTAHTEFESGNTYHSFNCSYTGSAKISFETAYKDRLRFAVVLICCGAFIFAFIPATIVYNTRKRNYEIFEYRLKTTNAMAHDLKTPLAAISAYAESMEGATEEEQNSYAEKIRENVSEMNRMVESILQFSKSEKETHAAETVYVDMEKMVRGSISKFEKLFEVNGIRTNVTVDSPCEMLTDEVMLRQAVENIVGNSAKYASEDSEVGIRISSDKVIFKNKTDEKIEDAESLKKPFVKGESARGENGTGLGLSIADNNLRALGYDLKLSFNDGWFTAEILISL